MLYASDGVRYLADWYSQGQFELGIFTLKDACISTLHALKERRSDGLSYVQYDDENVS